MSSLLSTLSSGREGGAARPPRAERVPVFPFAIATACVIGWIVCFAAGAVINSQPYRDFLNRPTNLEILATQNRGQAPKSAKVATSESVTGKDATKGGEPTKGGELTKGGEPTKAGETVKPAEGTIVAAAKGVEAKPTAAVLTREDLNQAVADAIKAQSPAELPKQTTGAYVKEGLSDIFSIWGILSVFLVVVTFTPPNLALLGALAAVAGAAGRWMMDGVSKAEEAARGEQTGPSASVATLRAWASTMMLSALSRGFFVYLAMLSGLLVLTGDPFDKPSPGQYVRLAGTCSLFCFIVGWQPELLKTIIAKFITRVAPEPQVETSKTTVTKKVESTVTQTLEAKKETAPMPAEGVTANGKDVGKGAGREKVETV